MNSYGLSLIYLAFLGFKDRKIEKLDLGEGFEEFMRFYAYEFDCSKTLINLGTAFQNYRNPFQEKSYYGGYSLFVANPFSMIFENVTPSCSLFPKIQECFKAVV